MTTDNLENHGNDVFVFTEIITPKQGRTDDVLEISRKSATTLKNQPGLIQSVLTRSEGKGGEILTITIWESKSDFQNFMKTDTVAELLKSDDMKNIKDWMSDYQMLMSELVDSWHG